MPTFSNRLISCGVTLMSDLYKTTLEFDCKLLMETLHDELDKPGKYVDSQHLASELGIEVPTLTHIRSGSIPDMKTLIIVCEYLQLDPGQFFYQIDWIGTRRSKATDGTG